MEDKLERARQLIREKLMREPIELHLDEKGLEVTFKSSTKPLSGAEEALLRQIALRTVGKGAIIKYEG
jgi:hypothetical protein